MLSLYLKSNVHQRSTFQTYNTKVCIINLHFKLIQIDTIGLYFKPIILKIGINLIK